MLRRLLALLFLTVPVIAQTAACTSGSIFDPTIPGQVTVCDPVPPGPACTVSVPGASTLCRVNGAINISENGSAFRPLFVPPVDVFKFVAPTNIIVSPSTTYYLGALVALGHNPDMVYLIPNSCTLTKIVYDARMSGAQKTPILLSLWDIEDGAVVPNSTVSQTWTGVAVESVSLPSWPVLAGDHLQVRFTMPSTSPAGFYVNLTITAYCTDN